MLNCTCKTSNPAAHEYGCFVAVLRRLVEAQAQIKRLETQIRMAKNAGITFCEYEGESRPVSAASTTINPDMVEEAICSRDEIKALQARIKVLEAALELARPFAGLATFTSNSKRVNLGEQRVDDKDGKYVRNMRQQQELFYQALAALTAKPPAITDTQESNHAS